MRDKVLTVALTAIALGMSLAKVGLIKVHAGKTRGAPTDRPALVPGPAKISIPAILSFALVAAGMVITGKGPLQGLANSRLLLSLPA